MSEISVFSMVADISDFSWTFACSILNFSEHGFCVWWYRYVVVILSCGKFLVIASLFFGTVFVWCYIFIVAMASSFVLLLLDAEPAFDKVKARLP